MLEHTKMPLTNQNGMVEILFSTHEHYVVPKARALELSRLLESLRYVKKLEPMEEWVTIETLIENDSKSSSRAGLALKGARLKEDLTQAQLAKLIKIRQENLSKMETGNRPISKTMAKRLAKVLNVDYRIFL